MESPKKIEKPKKKRLVIREPVPPPQAINLDVPKKRWSEPLRGSTTNSSSNEVTRKVWNEEFIEVLEKLTKLLAAQGEVFKSRAYKKAEETVRGIREDIVEVNQLKGKPGIGETILEKLQEYMNTGTLKLLEREKGKPEYIFAEIHGVGPKKAKDLVEKGVTTIAELRERQNELLNDVQKKGLRHFEDIQLKIPRAEIDEYKAIFQEAFNKATKGSDAKLEIVGSYRRGAVQSGDIDVIITATDPQMFPNFTKELESTNTILSEPRSGSTTNDGIILEKLSCGKTKCLVITKLPRHKHARRVDFMYTSPEEYPFAVLYFTGSKTFNTVMRGNALKMGFSLNEHGIYKKQPGKDKEEKVDQVFKDEKDIFTFLQMDYKEPTERSEGAYNLNINVIKEPVKQGPSPSMVPLQKTKIRKKRTLKIKNPLIPPVFPDKIESSPKKERTPEQQINIINPNETKKKIREPKQPKVPKEPKTKKIREPKPPKIPKEPKTKKIREPKQPKVPKEPKTKKIRELKSVQNDTIKKRGRPKKIKETVIPVIGSPKKEKTPQQQINLNNSNEIKKDNGEPEQPVKIRKKRTLKIKNPLILPVFPDKIESSLKKEKTPEQQLIPIIPLESKKQGTYGSPATPPFRVDSSREGSQGNRRFPAINKEEKEIKTSHNKTVRMSGKAATKKQIILFKKEGIKVLDTLNEKEIESMVIVANDAYYNSKNPLLTDNEYDIVREYAEKKYPDNETIKQVGAPITKNKVTLPYNMPSMDKIKPDTNALANWMNKYKGPYVLSCKLDGVSGLYTTEGSEPKLYTRGDGKVGQDVSHLLRVLKLPLRSSSRNGARESGVSGTYGAERSSEPYEGEQGYAIRGEFIIPKKIFEEKYKSQFANPRNLVSGIVNSKTLDDKTNDLHFVTYEVINPPMKVGEQMDTLAELGHEVVKNERKNTLSNDELSKTLLDWRANYEYEVDGVIVADDNIHHRKDGNPEYAFAFKMVISDQMAEAKVVDVLWEASKSGYLKPRVQIEPIKLGGVTIQYATGFNGDFIEKNKIGIGAVIQLIRSGDVIPHIKSVTTPAESAKMPDMPYTWTKNHVDIVIENVEGDVTVRRKNITEFFTKLEVDGLSGKTVEKIMDAGFDTIPKILKMDKADFAKVKGFKETLINKISDGIRVQVEKASLLDIMAASNMFGRGIGERKIRPILEAEPTILTDPGSQEEKYHKLIQIKGIGQENAKSFTENIDKFMTFLKDCGLENKLTEKAMTAEEPKNVDKSHPLYEKRVVMSGVRDATVKEKLESVGGILEDSIGSKTFVLVVKSKGDKETSKTKYAKEHNIEIMEPTEFIAKYFA